MFRTSLAAFLASALVISSAQAHSLKIETGEFPGEPPMPWEVVTARADIVASDVGRQGAIFIAAATRDGAMMAFTSRGWEPFEGGTMEPAIVLLSLPARQDIVVFNSRDDDTNRDGAIRWFGKPARAAVQPEINLLEGQTLCEAARRIGADVFSIAVGYGVVTEEAERIVAQSETLNTGMDPDMIRLAFLHNDMIGNRKWREVHRADCSIPSQG